MSDVINAHDLGVAGGYIIEAAMQWDIDQLKAENTKLRKQCERLFDKALELGTENAKLRLLVRNLFRATHPTDRAELIANAAELGIEVDE